MQRITYPFPVGENPQFVSDLAKKELDRLSSIYPTMIAVSPEIPLSTVHTVYWCVHPAPRHDYITLCTQMIYFLASAEARAFRDKESDIRAEFKEARHAVDPNELQQCVREFYGRLRKLDYGDRAELVASELRRSIDAMVALYKLPFENPDQAAYRDARRGRMIVRPVLELLKLAHNISKADEWAMGEMTRTIDSIATDLCWLADDVYLGEAYQAQGIPNLPNMLAGELGGKEAGYRRVIDEHQANKRRLTSAIDDLHRHFPQGPSTLYREIVHGLVAGSSRAIEEVMVGLGIPLPPDR